MSQISRLTLSHTHALAGAIASSAEWLVLLFGMLAMLLTPIAAVVVLVVSLLHRWRLGVVGVLWIVVMAAMGLMLPAMDSAMSDWMVLQGAGISR